MDTAFRKIDIDQYDEDVLLDSELYEADSRDPTEVLDDAKQRQIAVRSFLARYTILFLSLPLLVMKIPIRCFEFEWAEPDFLSN
jgi:hypothetical protein